MKNDARNAAEAEANPHDNNKKIACLFASGQNPTLGTRALSDRCHAVAVIPRMPMLACKRSWEVSG
jgi:hypothetical protein